MYFFKKSEHLGETIEGMFSTSVDFSNFKLYLILRMYSTNKLEFDATIYIRKSRFTRKVTNLL